MCALTCVYIRYTAVGLCEAFPYTNHPKTAVKNPAVHNQRAAVRFYIHASQWSSHSICCFGDWQVIRSLPPTAGMPSQLPHHYDDHCTHHRTQFGETVADWSIPHSRGRLTCVLYRPFFGSRRVVINGWLLPSCYVLLIHLIIAPYEEEIVNLHYVNKN